jgi:hypothetical protein
MRHALRLSLLAALVVLAAGCRPPDQRLAYRRAIDKFSARLPKAPATCWITPDLSGPSAGSNAIAEEEFAAYIVEKGLCRVVEKHGDAAGGYEWPSADQCPCPANVTSCSAQCGGGGVAGGLGFGGGGGGPDNNRSVDKLLERYKKSRLAQKVIVYRIDELTKQQAVIHFRVSDARSATVDAVQTVVVELVAPVRRDE